MFVANAAGGGLATVTKAKELFEELVATVVETAERKAIAECLIDSEASLLFVQIAAETL